MSLGGLALGVGMLVDCSIVVLESIFRCREEGDDIVTAAVRGTREVKGAVVASTLTTVAVFFPMVFVEGIAGQAFGDLAWSVVISLLASLAVAVYFIPMLASRQRRHTQYAQVESGSWKTMESWRDFSERLRNPRKWQCNLALPFLFVRFVFWFVFELFGKLILLLVGGVLWLAIRLFKPLWFLVNNFVLRPLVKLSGYGIGGLSRFYPKAINWALESPQRRAAGHFALWLDHLGGRPATRH